MKKRRRRAIAKARFYLEVYENKKYWTWRFDNTSRRNFTQEELKAYNRSLDSLYEPTGINIFKL